MHQVYTSLTDDATLHLPPEKLLFSSRRRFCGNLVKTRSMINWDNDGDIYIYIYWLVVYLPLWKIWVRQMGLFFPTEWKNKIHVPNHQPVMVDMSMLAGFLNQFEWLHGGSCHLVNRWSWHCLYLAQKQNVEGFSMLLPVGRYLW